MSRLWRTNTDSLVEFVRTVSDCSWRHLCKHLLFCNALLKQLWYNSRFSSQRKSCTSKIQLNSVKYSCKLHVVMSLNIILFDKISSMNNEWITINQNIFVMIFLDSDDGPCQKVLCKKKNIFLILLFSVFNNNWLSFEPHFIQNVWLRKHCHEKMFLDYSLFSWKKWSEN